MKSTPLENQKIHISPVSCITLQVEDEAGRKILPSRSIKYLWYNIVLNIFKRLVKSDNFLWQTKVSIDSIHETLILNRL